MVDPAESTRQNKEKGANRVLIPKRVKYRRESTAVG